MSNKSKKELSMEEELKLLRAENHDLRCHKVVFEELVLQAKEVLNIDLKKNYEADVLKRLNIKKSDFE